MCDNTSSTIGYICIVTVITLSIGLMRGCAKERLTLQAKLHSEAIKNGCVYIESSYPVSFCPGQNKDEK